MPLPTSTNRTKHIAKQLRKAPTLKVDGPPFTTSDSLLFIVVALACAFLAVTVYLQTTFSFKLPHSVPNTTPSEIHAINSSATHLVPHLLTLQAIVPAKCDLQFKHDRTQLDSMDLHTQTLCRMQSVPGLERPAFRACALLLALLRNDIDRFDDGDVDVDLNRAAWRIHSISAALISHKSIIFSSQHALSGIMNLPSSSISWIDRANASAEHLHSAVVNAHRHLTLHVSRALRELALLKLSTAEVVCELGTIADLYPPLAPVIRDFIGLNYTTKAFMYGSGSLTKISTMAHSCRTALRLWRNRFSKAHGHMNDHTHFLAT